MKLEELVEEREFGELWKIKKEIEEAISTTDDLKSICAETSRHEKMFDEVINVLKKQLAIIEEYI